MLGAQVAANHKGILLVQELIRECGLDVVHAYMRYIQVRGLLWPALMRLSPPVACRRTQSWLCATCWWSFRGAWGSQRWVPCKPKTVWTMALPSGSA